LQVEYIDVQVALWPFEPQSSDSAFDDVLPGTLRRCVEVAEEGFVDKDADSPHRVGAVRPESSYIMRGMTPHGLSFVTVGLGDSDDVSVVAEVGCVTPLALLLGGISSVQTLRVPECAAVIAGVG